VDVDQKSKDLVDVKKISGKLVSLHVKYNALDFTPLGAISAELGFGSIHCGGYIN
jgi:hypothetical protein